MSEYLYEGNLRSPDELKAIADHRKRKVAELEADLENRVTLYIYTHKRLEKEIAFKQAVAELPDKWRKFESALCRKAYEVCADELDTLLEKGHD